MRNNTIGVKDGWRFKFVGHMMLLVHPNHEPRLVDMRTVKEGDWLPRESDEAIKFDGE